ncbi:MAG TPA: class I SAM-dependent methyltransferase, partial [Leptolinea sp.]
NQCMKSYFYRSISRLLLWGFDLLYHQFSFLYDFAAWLVSAGHWNEWIQAAGKRVQTGLLLDIGCGKGILLAQAASMNIQAIGLDESPYMLRYSLAQLQSISGALVRGIGQTLPFKSGCFQTITATFPAPYLFETATLEEINRIMISDGNLIILLTANVTGSTLHERLIRCFTGILGWGLMPASSVNKILIPLIQAGFDARIEMCEIPDSRLVLIIGHPV